MGANLLLLVTTLVIPRLPVRVSHQRASVRLAAVKNFYDLLGVSQEADAQDIRRAYRRQALRKHPDVNKAPGAAEEFDQLSRAYKTLVSPEERRKYDRQLRFGSEPSGQGVPGGARQASESPEARRRRAERETRWRAANPMPEDLNDSFGAVLGDLLKGLGSALEGNGLEDWLSYMETNTAGAGSMESNDFSTMDVDALREELDDLELIVKTLDPKLRRLQDEVNDSERLAMELLDRARASDNAVRRQAASERARSVRQEAAASRQQRDAVQAHIFRAQDRMGRLEEAIAQRSKQPSRRGQPRAPTADFKARVEQDLQALKREMGL